MEGEIDMIYDIFYRGDLPSSYEYVILKDNSYILLDSPTSSIGFEFYPNVSSGAYSYVTVQDTSSIQKIQTSDSFLARKDFVSIAICCFIFLFCLWKLLNYCTVWVQKGGVLSDL